jgi:hypothetical protein
VLLDKSGIDRIAFQIRQRCQNEKIVPKVYLDFRHSGESRTKARSALNAQRAARRVSEANNPLSH